ncbi:hypothetical protein BHE90_010109 [Fusarium euwallaceae]|uniref:Uncharacterized protein n=1 Tax=Fusarium euwallaceae TaxID=1147111 RepID=A0A430LI63_9HYPO|nr:hypothetical protein BHE90_010109 [Fusarium euwallaceae]
MGNRDENQDQTPQDIPIFIDDTATLAGSNPENNDHKFVLQPIDDNRQEWSLDRIYYASIGRLPFPVEVWMYINTSPTDPTSPTELYASPQALARAQATRYPPKGQPLTIDVLRWGYRVTGEWHIGYLVEVLHQRQQRNNPDVVPLWTRMTLQILDDSYRNMAIAFPGTIWPTAAVGMTVHLPALRAVERSGINVWSVDQSGYVSWTWQGTQ